MCVFLSFCARRWSCGKVLASSALRSPRYQLFSSLISPGLCTRFSFSCVQLFLARLSPLLLIRFRRRRSWSQRYFRPSCSILQFILYSDKRDLFNTREVIIIFFFCETAIMALVEFILFFRSQQGLVSITRSGTNRATDFLVLGHSQKMVIENVLKSSSFILAVFVLFYISIG